MQFANYPQFFYNGKMTDKKILIIGAGNMAQPMIISLIKHQKTAPENLTIVTGKSAGKNKAAIHALFAENNLTAYNNCVFEKTPPANLPAPDVVIFAAKPVYFEQIATQYQSTITPDTQVVSIATAITTQDFKKHWGEGISVIRTMPHLPRGLYGIYADAKVDMQFLQTAFNDMGKPIILENEDADFHRFAAHSGCGPAFIAQFLARLPDEKQREAATDTLTKMAKGEKITGNLYSKEQQQTITRTVNFYNHWLSVAQYHFTDKAAQVLNPTILSTIAHLEKTHIAPADFARKVRSAKGVTNAGLLVMGSPPPNDPHFGDKAEMIAQTAESTYYQRITPEDSIVYALLASEARSVGMGEKTELNKHPLYLAGNQQFADIKREGDVFLQSLQTRTK
jgi:pyrroline-5-carboxylate reductase